MAEFERLGLLGALCLGLGSILVVGSSNYLGAGLGDDYLGGGASLIGALH